MWGGPVIQRLTIASTLKPRSFMPSDRSDKGDGGPDVVGSVDFGLFLDGRDKEYVADALLESLRTIGFVFLVNHGLSQEKIDQMFELVS